MLRVFPTTHFSDDEYFFLKENKKVTIVFCCWKSERKLAKRAFLSFLDDDWIWGGGGRNGNTNQNWVTDRRAAAVKVGWCFFGIDTDTDDDIVT